MSLADVPSRMLARYGRPMQLRRRTSTASTFISADVIGREVAFQPQEIVGEVRMGDQRVTITPDVGTLGTPEPNDMIHIDGAAWRVMGAAPRKLGAQIVGWTLWVRGGGK